MQMDAAASDVVAFSGQHTRTEHIALSEGGAVATKTTAWNSTVYAAASGAVMRGAGRFVAQFTVLKAFVDLYFGVVADGWDCKGEEDPWNVQGHCFYNVHSGRHWPSCGNWAGMQPAAQGDRIVLLLDLAAGSMEVYKNGVRLGALQADGLGGGGAGYRWAVGLLYGGDAARFEAIPLAEMPAAQDDLVARHDLVVVARTAGERDLPLVPGTRVHVQGHGAGAYERLEHKWLGANLHHIGFAGGSRAIQLRDLGPEQWAVLPPSEPEPEPGPEPEPEPAPEPAGMLTGGGLLDTAAGGEVEDAALKASVAELEPAEILVRMRPSRYLRL